MTKEEFKEMCNREGATIYLNSIIQDFLITDDLDHLMVQFPEMVIAVDKIQKVTSVEDNRYWIAVKKLLGADIDSDVITDISYHIYSRNSPNKIISSNILYTSMVYFNIPIKHIEIIDLKDEGNLALITI